MAELDVISDDDLLNAASKALAVSEDDFLTLSNKNEQSEPFKIGSELFPEKKYFLDDYGLKAPLKLSRNALSIPNESLIENKIQGTSSCSSTVGSNWGFFPTAELTPENKYDVQLIMNREGIDLKRHYKKNVFKKVPKLFQVGVLVDEFTDHSDQKKVRKLQSMSVAHSLLRDIPTRRKIIEKFALIQKQRSNFEILKNKKKTFSR